VNSIRSRRPTSLAKGWTSSTARADDGGMLRRLRDARRPRASVAAVLTAWVACSACTTTPIGEHPRAALPIPEDERARFSAPEVELVALDALETHVDVDVQRGTLALDGAERRFELYLPKRWAGPRPFLTVLPILGGGENVTVMVGTRLARRGIAAGTLERPWKLFKRQETVPELERKFIDAVREQRAFLDWVAERPDIDRARLGTFGLSAGGMVATVLAAVDPRVECSIIALAGGKLGTLVIEADEIRSRRWVQERLRLDGIAVEELRRRIESEVRVDPVDFAPCLDPRSVLFVSARFDGVVPRENIEALWEALGEPERIRTPFGHYTSALVLDSIVAAADGFARRRFGLAHERSIDCRDYAD
jgi:hypothetical protein